MGEINQNEESQADELIKKYDNLLDFCSYYMLPLSRKIGMTAEEFWDDDPYLFFAYLDAYNENEKNKYNMELYKCYYNGVYTLQALQQVLQFTTTPKNIFPKQPYGIQGVTKKELTIKEKNDMWEAYLNSKLKF